MIPFAQINAAALAQLPSLLREWLPAGKIVGREYLVGDVRGAPGDSLSINTQTGKWADFAADLRGGDPISLAAAIFHHGDQSAAALDLGKKLGVYLNGSAASAPEPAPASSAAADWHPIVPPPDDAPAPDLSGYDIVYTYRDAAGAALFYVRRREARGTRRKQFNPLTYGTLNGAAGWHMKHPVAPRPLYGLERLSRSGDVILCEGEKAADAAQRLFPNLACVSWPAGTAGVAAVDWSPLARRHVLIWPDNDAPGHKAAHDIANRLRDLALAVIVIPVDDLPDKADAADIQTADAERWLAERLARVPEEAPPDAPEDDPGYWEGLGVSSSGAASAPTQPPRRSVDIEPIRVVDGNIDLIATEGEAALAKSTIPVFQRGRDMVRPVRQEVPTSRGGVTLAPSLAVIATPSLIDLLNQAVEWQRFQPKAKEWRPTNPPKQVAEVILSRVGSWTVPSVAGVITTPTLRPDGSLLHEPGYDAVTRLYHVKDRSLTLSETIHNPTREDAEEALATLQALLVNFPFVSETDRAVALSALITGVTRGALSVAPMHAFRAYAAGSGKSYLADLMSYIATGRACPVMAIAAKEDETEKRLVGLLVAGFPIISIDNVNGDLGGDLLCQAVERPLVRVRVLGKSDIIEIESRASIIATGNGFRVRGDMTRRTLICTLDAKVERPELRTFDFDPVEYVLANRGIYVSACLTIVRAYMAADPVDIPPVASFNEWSDRVRGALVWLGCEDPVSSMETAREDDPDLAELRELAGLWRERIGPDVKITINKLVEQANARQIDDHGNSAAYVAADLRDMLMRLAGDRGAVNTKRLGKWMSGKAGRIVDKMRFEKGGTDRNGVMQWLLRCL